MTRIVHFGDKPAEVPLAVIEELISLRQAGDIITVQPTIEAGSEVTVASGPLRGVRALVSRLIPARQRVAILLEILGRPREVEIETERVLLAHPRRQA